MFWKFVDWAVRKMCKVGIHNWNTYRFNYGAEYTVCIYCGRDRQDGKKII